MGQEILFGIGAALLLAAIAWGVMRSGRLKAKDKIPGDRVAEKRYENDQG